MFNLSSAPALTVSAPRFPFSNLHVDGETGHGAIEAIGELMRNDGPDDLATAMTQVLPKLGQDIVGLASTVALTPLVVIGAHGAIGEAKEEFENYLEHLEGLHAIQETVVAKTADALMRRRGQLPPDVLDDKLSSLERMKAAKDDLHRTIERYNDRQEQKTLRQAIADRSLPEMGQAIRNLAYHPAGAEYSRRFIDEVERHFGEQASLSYDLDALRRGEAARRNANVGRCAAALTAAAMTGMAAGMFPSIGRAIAAITGTATAAGATAHAGAAVAASTLSTIAGGVFIPTQAMITAAELLNVSRTVKDNAALKRIRGAITETGADRMAPATLDSVREVNERERVLNNKDRAASIAVAAGQTSMIVGGTLNMIGPAAIAGAPLSAAGAALTIGGAIAHVATDKKKGKFEGEGATDFAQATQAERRNDTQALIAGNRADRAMEVAAGHFARDQSDLAEAKLLSLITHAWEAEKKRTTRSGAAYSPQKVHDHVVAMLKDGHKTVFHGSPIWKNGIGTRSTTLLKSDLARMIELFDQHYGRRFFDGDLGQLEGRLHDAMQRNARVSETAIDPQIQGKIAKEVLGELLRHPIKYQSAALRAFGPGQKKKEVTGESLQQFLDGHPKAREAANTVSRNSLTHIAKNDLKFLRYQDYKNIAESALAIQHGAVGAPGAPPSEHDADGNLVTHL